MLKPTPLPSLIVLQLLERCNLRCAMCYEWGERGTYASIGGRRQLRLDRVLELIQEAAPQRPRYEFFGGEPLLYRGLDRVLEAIASRGSEVSFSTNGWRLAAAAPSVLPHPPRRLWVSIDGPPDINDAQRGAGVYARALAGIERLATLRGAAARPEIGVTTIVTAANWHAITPAYVNSLPLDHVAALSIELCCYATPAQLASYRAELRPFGVTATPYADAYGQSPADFAAIDCAQLAAALVAIGELCAARGIELNLQPRRPTARNLAAYFRGDFAALDDARARCAMPWVAAEISAAGEVSTCHSFYDASLGNIYRNSLREIWHDERAQQWRARLREGLLSICTACCRYHSA